jgi:hypothetical protein
MLTSEKCECSKSGSWRFRPILGRGKCEKHGIYHMSHKNRMCPRCAKEKGVCPDCGKKLN